MKGKILITGGLGYVGGRIAEYLSRDNNLHMSIGTRRDKIAVPDWIENGGVVQMDLASRKSLEDACAGVKYVIHLAAMNEIDSARDPEAALAVNGQGTLRLLEAAKSKGVDRFIYLSTAHVYGKPLEGRITEQTLPRPVHPYAITHRVAEDFVLAAHDTGALTGVVLRLSNSFGAPNTPYSDRWTLIVNDLCRQAVEKRKLTLRSSGMQERDFIALEDVGKAVLHFLQLKTGMCGDGLFNLGGEYSIRIIDLAELIAQRCEAVLGFLPVIERQEAKPFDTCQPLHYSLEKAKATGFTPTCDFSQEIDATMLFCEKTFGGHNGQ